MNNLYKHRKDVDMKQRWLLVLVSLALVVGVVGFAPVGVTRAAPVAGNNCVSAGSGNWNVASTWTGCGGVTPDSGDNVFIQSGHTVTLTQDQDVSDLNISTGTTSATTGGEGLVVLGSNTLHVYGKLRCYFASVGTTPGTSTTSVGPSPITITAASGGKISFVGNSHNITAAGEWGAGNTAATTTFAVEINMNSGQTATMATSIKASSWNILAGTLDAGNNRIAADNGATGGGNVTIASGATLISSSSGATGNAVIGRTSNASTGYGGTLTVNGRLTLTGGSPTVAMSTVNLPGTIEYTSAGAQTLLAGTGGGVSPLTYTDLTIGGTLAKTLSGNTTVNGTLIRGGTSALVLSTFSLTYGPNGTLEYAGSNAQTTGNEFPASSGPLNLTINNSNGVTLSGDRTINDVVALTNGDLTTGANILTLGPSATTSGSSDVVGNVHRATFTPGTTYSFGNPNVSLNFDATGTPPSDVTITLAKTQPSGFTYAVDRTYDIAATGGTNYAATLRLRYLDSELHLANGATEGSLRLFRYDGSNWNNQTRSNGDTTNNWVETSGVTAFSPWTLSGNSPTAITLTTLSGRTPSNDGWIVLILLVAGALLIGGWALRRRAVRD
jgi:hypothetical protein